MYNGNNGLMNSCLERLVTVTLCNATYNRLFISSDNVRLYSKLNTLNVWSENVSRELKHARFSDADGNRKRTIRVLGPYCLPDFYTIHL